jgi:hypothetical protein
VSTWELHDPAYARPLAAPLERCTELLGVDSAIVQRAAANVEPYIRVDGKVWSLMRLERQLHAEAYGRVPGRLRQPSTAPGPGPPFARDRRSPRSATCAGQSTASAAWGAWKVHPRGWCRTT